MIADDAGEGGIGGWGEGSGEEVEVLGEGEAFFLEGFGYYCIQS